MTAAPDSTSQTNSPAGNVVSDACSAPEWPEVATGCAHGCCLLSSAVMILIGLAGIILSFLV